MSVGVINPLFPGTNYRCKNLFYDGPENEKEL